MVRRKKYENYLPDHIPTPEQQEAYLWGVEEGIIISPLGGKTKGEWKIGISNHWTPKEVKVSPESYGKEDIWDTVYQFYTFYYERSKDKKKPNDV